MAARSQTTLMTAGESLHLPDGYNRDERFEGTLLDISPVDDYSARLNIRNSVIER